MAKKWRTTGWHAYWTPPTNVVRLVGRLYLLTYFFQRSANWYRLGIRLVCSERRWNEVVNLIVGRQIGSCMPKPGSRTGPDHPRTFSSTSSLPTLCSMLRLSSLCVAAKYHDYLVGILCWQVETSEMYKGATTTHADPTMQRCADPTRCLKIFFSALQSHRKKVSVFFYKSANCI